MHILKHTTSVGTFYATEDGYSTTEKDAKRFYSFRAAKAKDADLKREIKRAYPDVNFFSSEVEEVAYYVETTNTTELPPVTIEQVRPHAEDLIEYSDQVLALAAFKELNADEVSVSNYDGAVLKVEGEEWLVLTNEEATERAEAYIRDSLWAFNPSFIKHYMPLKNEKVIAMIQEACEDCNEEILDMVGNNLQALMDDAIDADGRGHFMNTYDGNEYIETVGNMAYYLYRTY